jgi:hypothetical protein
VSSPASQRCDDLPFSESFLLKILPDGEANVALYSDGLVSPLHETELNGLNIVSGRILDFTIRQARAHYLDMFGNPFSYYLRGLYSRPTPSKCPMPYVRSRLGSPKWRQCTLIRNAKRSAVNRYRFES